METKMYRYFEASWFRLVVLSFLLTILALCSLAPKAYADTPQWQTLGGAGISSGAVVNPATAEHNGTIYVAFTDSANSSKATVMKYNGGSWQTVGSVGFTAGSATFISLAIKSDGTPYIAFNDGANDNKLTVEYFDGTSWNIFHDPGFSDLYAKATNIAFDDQDNLYVAYQDVDIADPESPTYNYRTYNYKKFDGSDWVQIGQQLVDTSNTGNLAHVPILFKDSTIYTAVQYTNSVGTAVLKLVNNTWTSVSSNDSALAGLMNYVSPVIVGNEFYAVMQDGFNSGRAKVFKSSGGSWSQVGNDLTTTAGSFLALTELNGTIYASGSYSVSGPPPTVKPFVKKFDGTNWVDVGGDVSQGGATSPAITTDGKSLIVAVRDLANTNKLTVMKYTGSSQSLADAESSKAVTLDTPSGTDITCSSTAKEVDNTTADADFSYPLGLVNFCFSTGQTDNEVSLVFETDLTPSQVVARKYNPNSEEYKTIDGAVITETTIEGRHALKVTYTITDNGELDTNDTVGEITDPVGLALRNSSNDADNEAGNTSGAPNTGLERIDMDKLFIVVGVIIGTITIYAVSKRIKHGKYSLQR